MTIMATRAWGQVIEALATPVDPGIRRANLLISGIELAHTRDSATSGFLPAPCAWRNPPLQPDGRSRTWSAHHTRSTVARGCLR